MIDLQKDLEKIFAKHAPEKIPMIPEIVERARGREKQVLDGVMDRLGISEVPVIHSPESPPANSLQEKPVRKGRKRWWLFLLIPILMVGAAIGTWYLKDIFVAGPPPEPTEMFVIASALYVRSEPCVNEAKTMDKLPFGSKVLVTETMDSCSSGDIWVGIDYKGTEQYLSLKYLGDRKDFEEINALFGNPEARDLNLQTRDKQALLDYFASHQMMGGMDPQLQMELYGKVSDREPWQIFGAPSGSFYDATDFGAFHDGVSFGKDVAVIISKLDPVSGEASGERRLLLFKFDKFDTGYMYSAWDLSQYEGYGIKTITDDEYLRRFPVGVRSLVSEERPAILIGSNEDVYARKYLLVEVEGEMQMYEERKRSGFWGL